MSKWQFSFDAQDPHKERGIWQCGVSPKRIKLLVKNSDEVWIARLALVKEVLFAPTRIIQGWGREKNQCWVYIGKPANDYRSATIQLPAPPKMLFTVFVLPDGTVDLWTWRPAIDNDPDMPEGMQGPILWPPTI